MGHKRSELVEPRDERELCGLFEDLLFLREEKMGMKPAPEDSRFMLSTADTRLLERLGITSRIFRRWYQTTWGWRNPSRHFSGETPRQELAVRYPELSSGDAYLGVELRESADGFHVAPDLYARDAIDQAGGVFALGRASLSRMKAARDRSGRLPPPNFDPGFKQFAANFERSARGWERSGVELPTAPEARQWKVFWNDVWFTLALNVELDMPHRTRIAVGGMVGALFEDVVCRQGDGLDDYVDVDETVYYCWEIFRRHDDRLLPYDVVRPADNRGIDALLSRAHGPYSLGAFYSFGSLFDELFLFPADRYFGAVECVWTDQENFLGDLVVAFQLLKNNLEFPRPAARTKNQEKFLAAGIENTATDIYRAWFCPPTVFRFLPRVMRFF